jgi:tetratricopeptide (TPR) repeat protein
MAYGFRAGAYEKIGREEKALEDISNAIAIEPNNDKSYVNRGFINYRSGGYYDAVEDFTRAIKIKRLIWRRTRIAAMYISIWGNTNWQ